MQYQCHTLCLGTRACIHPVTCPPTSIKVTSSGPDSCSSSAASSALATVRMASALLATSCWARRHEAFSSVNVSLWYLQMCQTLKWSQNDFV
jgi:hypothetical protein